LSTGTPAADLSVAALATPSPTIVNQLLRYTVSVTNNGPATATGVSLASLLPSGADYRSNSVSGTLVGNSLTCNLGTLISGAATNVDIYLRPTATGTYTSTVQLTGTQVDFNNSNNSAVLNTVVLAGQG